VRAPRGLAHGLFCVACGAKPGRRCKTITGRVRRQPHSERIDLAVDLARGRLNPAIAKGLWHQVEASGVAWA